MIDQEKKQEQETEQESERKRRRAIIIAALILLLIVGVTIGYAGLSGTLNINGETNVKEPDWGICFTQVRVASNSVTASRPAAIDPNDCTKVNYAVDLEYPGEFYEFDVDVKNFSLKRDAKAGSDPIMTQLTAKQSEYITYDVTYKDGSRIKKGDILSKDSTRTYTVRVEYKDTVTEDMIANAPGLLNLSFEIPYVQAD